MYHGWLNGVEDALGDLLGLEHRHVVADDDELVAAEPRHGVAGPDRLLDLRGGVSQQVVTGAVTQRVVDHLEVIDVEEHHGQLRAAASRPASPWISRSVSSARFGRPVSESCSA